MKNRLFQVSLLLCSALCSWHYAGAQITLGAKGGLSIPNLTSGSTSNPLNSGYSSRLGGAGAVFVDDHFGKLFSLQLQVEYSSQGGKKNGLQAFPNPDPNQAMNQPYLYANYKSETKLDYLMVPLLARVDIPIVSHFGVYAAVGPYVSFLMSAKQVTSGNSMVYLDAAGQQPITPAPESFGNTQDVKSSLNTTNFGIEGFIGIKYNFGRSSVFIEGGGNYGFVNIQKYSQDGKNNTGAGDVMIGYSFTL